MNEQASSDGKKPRFRSPPYPAIPLDKAIERASALYSKALHHAVPVAVAASAWDYGEKSSGLFATVAALKQFGLLTDEGGGPKRRFKLTDSAIRIVRDPDPNSDKRQAAIQNAALSPKIHSELWEKFETAGVSASMDVALKSHLTLDRADSGAAPYSDNAADEVIAAYRQTMTFAGLAGSPDAPGGEAIGGAGNDLPDASAESVDETSTRGQQHSAGTIHPPTPPALNTELNNIRVEISGGEIRISALLDLKGLDQLEKKIAAYKMLLQ